MITAAFISHADDWMLPHKLRVLSAISDHVCVILDRSPQSEAICRRFPKVDVRHVNSQQTVMGHDGPRWDEGRLRQAAWDFAAEDDPKFVVLGDTDEVPTPNIVSFIGELLHADIDCIYADWINLAPDAGHAIGGLRSPWSFQSPDSNKKGIIVRHHKGRFYRYRMGTRHVRMEPNPLSETRAVMTTRHQLASTVSLVHYRWANWPRWVASHSAKLEHYNPWPPAGAQIIDMPRQWLWRWNADEYLRSLPEPVAVVGNGPCIGRGDEIDAHPTIIRMNNFKIDGFAEHVGSRTTCWYANCWDDLKPRPWTGDMITGYADREQKDRLSRWLGMYPHMHVPLGESWFEAARKIKPDSPSHGLTLLARLVHHGKRVDAYGFDGLTTGHYFDAGHRHDHSPEVVALARLQVHFAGRR